MSAGAWMKFYPSDWRADPALRMCSLAARGLWMEMLCLMHESEPRGSLLVNGLPVNNRQLASLAGVSPREVEACLRQLEEAGVFSREDNGTIYSRRMRRDEEKAARDKAIGKRGGNPSLKGGVNPPDNGVDKAQNPDTRIQNKDAADAANGPKHHDPPDPEVELFRRGREVLGEDAGGLISRLLKANSRSVAKTRAVIETASTKQKPREYAAAALKRGGGVKRDDRDWTEALDLAPAGSDWREALG